MMNGEFSYLRTSITLIREYSSFYLVFIFYTLRTMYISSMGGELRLYALYVISLLVTNIGLVFANVIVFRNFSKLGLLVESFV